MANTERLESNNILTLKSKNSEEEEENEEEKKFKQSYSYFIIKMLETPNKKIKLRNKRQNNSLLGDTFKGRSKYNSLEVNNIAKINKKFICNNSKIIKIKNPIKNVSCSFNANRIKNTNYNNKKLNPIKLNVINKSNPYFNTFTINSYNCKNNYYNISKKKEEKNKSNENDKKEKRKKDKNILNKLYGYNKKYIFSKSNIFKKKNLIELDNYQNNILKISQAKLSRDNFIRQYTELQTIKTEADMIKPLPPVNFPALVIHSFKETNDKRMHINKPFESKKLKDMDEYEKELYKIKISNNFKRAKNVRNKRLYKILEILPEHVVDTVFRKKSKII